MVDRIDKLKPSEYWKLEGSNETKKDKKRDSESEEKFKQASSFEEKNDWNRLITKELKREPLTVKTVHIQSLRFKGLTSSREQASVEVDLSLKDGSQWNSALLAVSRNQGLKLLHYQAGEEIPVAWFGVVDSLKFSVLPPHREATEPATLARSNQKPLSVQRKKNREVPLFVYVIVLLLGLTAIYFLFRWVQ
ncbi:MAG: hypothetical protein JNK65_08720 [Deltaproteobacteria bacterium]|nr:hypothetical protein [Deltaproteobacteria bacterium]